MEEHVRMQIWGQNDKYQQGEIHNLQGLLQVLIIAFPHIKCPAKWDDLLHKCEGYVQGIKVCLVAWSKPPRSEDQGKQ